MADINLPSVQTSANPLAALLEAAGAFFTTFTQAKMQKQQMEAQRAHEMALAETRGRFNVEAAKAQQGEAADPIGDILRFRVQSAQSPEETEYWTSQLMRYELAPETVRAEMMDLLFGGGPESQAETKERDVATSTKAGAGVAGAGRSVLEGIISTPSGVGRFFEGVESGITGEPPPERVPSVVEKARVGRGFLEALRRRAQQSPEVKKKTAAGMNLQSHVDTTAKKYGVDPAVVRAMIQAESAGVAGAVSPKGALGLMQLMPDTAAELGVDRTDPYQNIEGGTRYFSQQLKRFGDVDKALAAYNFGPDNVASGEPWPKETRKFVKKVKRLAGLEESP